MARKHESQDETPEPVKTGTERILSGEKGKRKVVIPGPQIDKPAPAAPPVKAEKKPDPNKPKDVEIGSAHIIATIGKTAGDNRMTRLIELARTDNDVKWLLAEHQPKHSKSKSKT